MKTKLIILLHASLVTIYSSLKILLYTLDHWIISVQQYLQKSCKILATFYSSLGSKEAIITVEENIML